MFQWRGGGSLSGGEHRLSARRQPIPDLETPGKTKRLELSDPDLELGFLHAALLSEVGSQLRRVFVDHHQALLGPGSGSTPRVEPL